MSIETCDRCGIELLIGAWPYCKGDPSDHAPGGAGFQTPFSPYVDEHLLPDGKDVGDNGFGIKVQGTMITSREQRNAIMKEHHLHADSNTRGVKRDRGERYSSLTDKVHQQIMDRIRERG